MSKTRAPARRRRIMVIDVAGPTLVFAAFLGFWYWLSYYGMAERRRFLVPPIHEVIQDGFLDWKNFSVMLEALWLTAQVALWGLGIAIGLGTTCAILMSQARWIERSVWPYAVALQSIPILLHRTHHSKTHFIFLPQLKNLRLQFTEFTLHLLQTFLSRTHVNFVFFL